MSKKVCTNCHHFISEDKKCDRLFHHNIDINIIDIDSANSCNYYYSEKIKYEIAYERVESRFELMQLDE